MNFALGNYELTGNGKLSTGTVKKRGNSILTVSGAGFAGPVKIDVEVGTLKLGSTGTYTSLGELGEVVIHDGASFDVNYTSGRKAATQATTFHIAGTGVLTGMFRFAAGSVWEMTGTAQAVVAANVAGVTDTAFLTTLGKVKVAFSEVPTKGVLDICDAGVLTNDKVRNVAVEVTGPDKTMTEGWHLSVVDGKLRLCNPEVGKGLLFLFK